MTKRSFRFHAFVWGMAAVITLWHVVMMAAAKADHELGPAPHVYAFESDERVTVTLSPGCPYTSSYIDYRTEDLTAEAGKDYVHVSGRLMTGPWKFDIPILEDSIPEPDEVAKIIISGPSDGAPGGGGGSCVGDDQSNTGSLTILENDGFAPPQEQQSAPAQVARRQDGSSQPAGQSNVAAPSRSQRAAAGTTPVESGVQDSTEVSIAEGLPRVAGAADQRKLPAFDIILVGALVTVFVAGIWVGRRRKALL